MALWEHSHNLNQTPRDRLARVVRELQIERGNRASQASTEGQRGELQRIDKALLLLQQALETLAG
jgi:hypothetical protein